MLNAFRFDTYIFEVMKSTSTRLSRILLFYGIAIVVSNLFRFDVFNITSDFNTIKPIYYPILLPLEAIGVFIGALIALYLLKQKHDLNYSFLGNTKLWSVVLALTPVLLLAVIGVKNPNYNDYYYAFFSGLATLMYCYFEEIGWRGYLQQELIHITQWKRVVIIGSLWYIPFLNNHNIGSNLQFLGILIFASWGLGNIMIKTKSVFLVSSFHMLVQIMMYNNLIKNGITFQQKLIIIGITIFVWLVIFRFFLPKHQN